MIRLGRSKEARLRRDSRRVEQSGATNNWTSSNFVKLTHKHMKPKFFIGNLSNEGEGKQEIEKGQDRQILELKSNIKGKQQDNVTRE